MFMTIDQLYSFIQYLMVPVLAVVGWLIRNNYNRHEALQKEFQDFKVKVAAEYVTTGRMDRMETRILDAIKDVQSRVDSHRRSTDGE
jgi:hypothetical protein